MQTLSSLHFLQRRDLARAVARKQYEFSERGIAFPKLGCDVGGIFTRTRTRHGVRGTPIIEQNIVPLEMRDFILALIAKNQAPIAAWYATLYTGEVTPDEDLTAANFHATMTEFEGYSGGVRLAWTAGAVADGAVDNSASPAVFAITATATVQGAALLSSSVRTGTGGKILCCAPFTGGERDLVSGDNLSLEYGLAVTSA
jgi:hypothetical protein